MRGLLTPALAGFPRHGDRDGPSVVLTSSLQTLVGWTRRGWGCCAAGDVTVFPAFVGVCGEAPGAWLPIGIATVILLQVLAWKFGRDIPMSVWALRVPGLAVESRHGLGDISLIMFSTAVHTFFFTFRDVTVVISLVWVRRVAPGSLVVVVWIPAVILLQSVIGVCVGGIVGYVGGCGAPLLTGNPVLRLGHGSSIVLPDASLTLRQINSLLK